MSDQITIADDPAGNRYELRVDGALAGFVGYQRQPGQIAFMHTQIDDRYEGRGLGSKLISGVLDEARASGTAVLPFCPFVNGYIKRHREYADLVPAESRSRFGL